MNTQRYGKLVLLVLLAVQISTAATFKVAQDGTAAHTSIQGAIDAAGAGDVIEIIDFGVYLEQVTIDSSKNGLTLKSSNPTSNKKPVIKFQDKINVLPKTYNQAQHGDSINFDQNGALRVMRARNVTINGIKIDGGGPAPFSYPGIWNQKDPLFHGNAGLCLWVAGDVVVKNCDFTNAYFGINVKDRNEGGIFANANPADIAPWNVVPLSGFGQTGNHIFEDNKIHHNSWGIFFESTWDLGSVVRYNLFYENHHTAALAARIAGMEDGGNQPGGAILFKDMLLSPLAIYNNTFWHNHTALAGHWRAGAQHLVFNNIVARPDSLANNFMSIDAKFVNRMHNCLYAVQSQAVQMRSQEYSVGRQDPVTNLYVEAKVKLTAAGNVRIMEGMTKIEVAGQNVLLTLPFSSGPVDTTVFANWVIQPGAAINDFPAGSNVRWFEMKFLSTDTASADFLVPDWDDPVVENLVADKGWVEAGILDADGSIADLGARPKGGRATTEVLIKPAEPVMVNGTKATVIFDVYGLEKATLSDLRIKYVRWIKNVPFMDKAFGSNEELKPLPASSIVTVSVPSTQITMGSNTLEFSIPSRTDLELYAFFEIVLEGENANGQTEATSVGFLPYRKLDYIFEVEILDMTRTTVLTEVKVGQSVIMKIVPKKAGDTAPFGHRVSPVSLALAFGDKLYSAVTGDTVKIDGVEIERFDTVMFTKIPTPGYDRITVTGVYQQTAVFMGSTEVKILPGDPEKISFEDPPSGSFAIINPGPPFIVTLKVQDKFGNAVGSGIQVKVRSTRPEFGDILNADGSESGGSDVTGITDSTGFAYFNAVVTDGDLNDTFPLIATLVLNSATDNSALVVGQSKPKFFILYGDTLDYDTTVELRGCAGQKFPVTVIASIDGDTLLTALSDSFDIELDNGIYAYETDDPLDTVRITYSALVSGKKTIWIKSTSGQHSNKKITVSPRVNNSVLSGYRNGIYFDFCGPMIERAAYYGENGDGQVDRMDIWYKEDIEGFERPDSFQLYWPDEFPNYLRMVRRTDTTFIIDPNNARHLTVYIGEKFEPKLTSSHKTRLGTSFWNDPNQPDAATIKNAFSISDSIGPVLTFATVMEKLGSGNDTMFIRISEYVDPNLINGLTLTLVKKDGTTHDLNILKTIPISDTIMIVVEDALGNSPKYGDSLKILSSGTISDLFTNKAHSDNRPVPIGIKTIPATVVNSFYLDNDADGVVNQVNVKFDKFVIKDLISAQCEWLEGNNSTTLLTGIDLGYDLQDSTMIIINVLGKFRLNEIKTSGAMIVKIMYADFGVEKTNDVTDSAAPVIDKAIYFPGSALSADNFALDTLRVTFTEDVFLSTIPISNPFKFYHGPTEYAINLQTNPKSMSKEFEYVLVDNNSIQNVFYPENGDSININALLYPFHDQTGNYQINPSNRKVQLEVRAVPTSLDIKVGPNPFVAGESVTFIITPLAKMVENVNAKATVIIYDRMGNKMWQGMATSAEQPEENRGAIKIKWNGINRSGRIVEGGTYLAKVIAVDNNTGVPKKKNFLIGMEKK